MSSLAILDVLIGLILVYAILSLVNASLVEWMIQRAGTRGAVLSEAIEQMLGSSEARERFFRSPLINTFARPGRLPSYIRSEQFARFILNEFAVDVPAAADAAAAGAAPVEASPVPDAASQLRQRLKDLDDGPLSESLSALLIDVSGDITAVRTRIEGWYDDVMERATGWFRKHTTRLLILIGIPLVLLTNADTIRMTTTLLNDDGLRTSLVAHVSTLTESDAPSISEATLNEAVPLLGWSAQEWGRLFGSATPLGERWLLGIQKLVGLSLSCCAIGLGAPFWFDLLGKLVSLRSSVAPASQSLATIKKSNSRTKSDQQ